MPWEYVLSFSQADEASSHASPQASMEGAAQLHGWQME